jgi:glucose uptake protein GlcU
MQTQQSLTPILSEQSLLYIAGSVFVVMVVAGIAFTIIFKKDPHAVKEFRGGRGALHYFTIVSVVFATILLALERILTGEAVASILGGIVGYVLGTLKQKSDEVKGAGQT